MQTLDFSARVDRGLMQPAILSLSSRNMLAFRHLSREQKSLDQLTFAANCHTGKSLVPLTLGYLGLVVEPFRQQF
jgi:hypothetical protein